MNKDKTVLKSIFGSHLFGTNVATSDQDYKEVYIPSLDSMLMGTSLKNKVAKTNKTETHNTENDVDSERINVITLIRDMVDGQTYAWELAFCPAVNGIETNPDFRKFLYKMRKECLNKDVNGMIGYCLGQSRKYSLKGDKLNEVKKVLKSLCAESPNATLQLIRDRLPIGEYLSIVPGEDNRGYYKVCDKMFLLNTTVGYVFPSIQNLHDKYGERAKAAAKMSGHDWKAIMHAVRVIGEAYELLTTNKLVFPRPERETLLKIRNGEMTMPQVQALIDAGLVMVESAAKTSNLPTAAEVKEKSEAMILTFLKEQYGINE
jgi:hypothetical protein